MIKDTDLKFVLHDQILRLASALLVIYEWKKKESYKQLTIIYNFYHTKNTEIKTVIQMSEHDINIMRRLIMYDSCQIDARSSS